MRAPAVLAREAAAEFRAGLASGIAPLIFAGLTAYLLLVLSSAGYLRDMNAADVPRNAPMLVYLMTPGMSFFLFFAWAWVFGQCVARERQAQLHEMVLAAPVPLAALLAGRWLGAWGVALLLGASQAVGFVAAPLLEAAGLVPAGSMGPTPWAALTWSWLIYTVPLSAGCGALYLLAALRTRGMAGPFAVAALLCVAWMAAMIVIKDGHISDFLVALIDPSGFGEAERQVLGWTPQEKRGALIAVTPGFAFNRVLWCLAPVLWLAWALPRVRRERLVLEAPAVLQPARRSTVRAAAMPVAARATSWWRALGQEARWQTAQVLRSRAAWLGGALLVAMGVAGAFVHVVGHAEGPMVPRPELLGPLLFKFTYLVTVFIIAALAGGMARRDERGGFAEMADAAPMPVALRFAACCIAVGAVAFVLVQLVALSSLIVTAIAAPQAFSLWQPVAMQALRHWPALMEVAVLVLLVHALVRRAGVAHAAAMLLAFVLVVNHEAALVDYPPYQIGLPLPATISAATGWGSWIGPMLAGDAWKLALTLLFAALAALAVPRGTDARWRVRLAEAAQRLRGPAGAALAVGLAGTAATGALLHAQLVEEGGWQSPAQQRADDAQWERRWLRDGAGQQAAFATAGGEVQLRVHPATRTVQGDWLLRGVQAPHGWLHAELPPDFTLHAAQVNGAPVAAETGHDHIAVPLGACAAGCDVRLSFTVAPRGWTAEGETPWLTPAGVWLRAQDVLPRLGFDAARLLRVPAERTAAGLPAEPRLPAWQSSVPAQGVAPPGDWRWRIAIDGEGVHEGRTAGALDFAALRAPRLHASTVGGLQVLHDATRAATAQAVAPRELGEPLLAGGLLWLPEGPHWDVADAGVGRTKRRAAIARALAARHVADAAALRQGPGGQWLAHGLPGAIGLLCVAATDAAPAVQGLMTRASAEATQALAASTAPVGPLALAPYGGWAQHHAPLAALHAVQQLDADALAALLAAVHGGMEVEQALARTWGAEYAAWMLGPPLASDLHADGTGERWRWSAGGWQSAGRAGGAWRLGDALWLDGWPAYERSPADNVQKQ
ncbi:MAG: hypothetical protein ABT02_13755 [Comamonadaceae bacterium SCN 68-20]|nr:MAG: hypothetical protein ABT02_13755 [Comamonadaceae bacterium SCN 68-20]